MGSEESEKGKSSGFMTKLIMGVFTAVVAPVVVALCIKNFAPKDDKSSDKPQTAQNSGDAGTATPKEKEPKEKEKEKEKDPVIHLAGADQSLWQFYENAPGYVRTKDTKVVEKIFQFTPGMVHVVGAKTGAMVSEDSYENYLLTVEYKWGPPPPPPKPTTPTIPPNPKDKTPPPKPKYRRASFEIHGQDTTAQTTWMPGIRILLGEREAGSVQLRGDQGKVSVTAHVVEQPVTIGKDQWIRRYFKPDGQQKTLTCGMSKNWNNNIYRLGLLNSSDDEESIKADEMERAGDWNKIELLCEGNSLKVKLNDREVIACTDLTPRYGRIVLFADGNEIFYRKIDILPLKKTP